MMEWIKSSQKVPKDDFLKYIKLLREDGTYYYQMIGWYSKESNLFYDSNSSSSHKPSENILWLEE